MKQRRWRELPMASPFVERIVSEQAGSSQALRPALTPLDVGFFRGWLAPLLLIVTTPLIAVLVWLTCVHFDGSILLLARTRSVESLLQLVPRPTWRAAAILFGWFIIQGLLLAVLPGKHYEGPPSPTGQRPVYKLNGIAAWLVTHGGLALSWTLGLWHATTVYREFGSMLVILNLSAIVFCLFLYWKGRNYPSTPDAIWTGHAWFDFFQGVELHPRLFGVDVKQFINCRISMMGWSVLIATFALAQYEIYGQLSSSMAVSASLIIVYLFKFFGWEQGYFTSLDIIHDRFGYYICWGVLVWVPSIYTLPGQYLVHHPRALEPAWAATLVAVGLVSIWVNSAADAQRQRVRATNGKTTVWGKAPALLRAQYVSSDGCERENLLLASGYWGLARHFHYVPELSLALCWSLPAGFDNFLPYFYFVFLAILLVDRANRDDKRCRAKYGSAWAQYCELVPYKIVPRVF
jgi:7-dehydrocholesterol reductase